MSVSSKGKFSIAQWIVLFLQGAFNSPDRETQINAGWFDWFCNDKTLHNRTQRLGNIIKDLKPDGKIDLEKWEVEFKNCCPFAGPLYDRIYFTDIARDDTQLCVDIDDKRKDSKYSVYGVTPDTERWSDPPIFETNDARILKRWLNTPWEKEEK